MGGDGVEDELGDGGADSRGSLTANHNTYLLDSTCHDDLNQESWIDELKKAKYEGGWSSGTKNLCLLNRRVVADTTPDQPR